jgi:DNA-binding NtrC family response regulator
MPDKYEALPKLEVPSIAHKKDDRQLSSCLSPEKGSQLLIVDDEKLLITTYNMMLMSEGFKTISCTSGKEALKIFKKAWKSIDLVLLDMVMPGMNGNETYKAMKTIDKNVKVLFFSGSSSMDNAEETDGAMGFIQKPILKKDFLAKIALALSGRRF